MKKLLLAALILGIALFSYGCQTASTSSGTATPDATIVASNLGGMMYQTLMLDGTTNSLLSVHGLSAKAASDLQYTGGWWTFTYSGIAGQSFTFKVKAYKADGTEITQETNLHLTNKIAMASSLIISGASGSITYSFGTESNPLTFDGIISGTKILNGPTTASLTDSTGSYSISMSYNSITLNAAGYPASGTASFSLTSTVYATTAGTVTFNSNNTCNLVFTSPSSLTGTTYIVDEVTGGVSPAAVR